MKFTRKGIFFTFSMIGLAFSLGSPVSAFESFEHNAAGLYVNVPFPGGLDQDWEEDYPYKNYFKAMENYEEKTGELPEYSPQYIMVKSSDGTEEIKIGYGEIIALAGDFFGLKDKTISFDFPLDDWAKYEQRMKINFAEAFKTLRPNPGNPFLANNNLNYLRSLFQEEYKGLVYAMTKEGGVQLNLANSHTVKSKIDSQIKYAKSYAYGDLLGINMDHFGLDATKSYLAGHKLALEKAKEAHYKWEKGEKEEAISLLNTAYAYNAFASHFFSDLFSSGHLRTPRRELYHMEMTDPGHVMRGLMANSQHDEDGYLGLWVASEARPNEPWKCFGDASLFDKKSSDNRENLVEALQVSIDEVFDVFESGELPENILDVPSLTYLPTKVLPNVENPLEELGNHNPLYRVEKEDEDKSDDKSVVVRASYYDVSTEDYVAIKALTGLTSFLKNDQYSYNHANFYSFLLEEDFSSNYKKEATIDCYNEYNRDAWTRYPKGSQVKIDAKETVYVIDNRVTNFYEDILEGTLNPNGIYFVVSLERGEELIRECEKLMSASHNIGDATTEDVVEIRGEVKGNGDHPVVVYTEKGQLRRLLGHDRIPTGEG